MQIKLFFISKSFNIYTSKAGICPLCRTRKKLFDTVYCLYKMKQSHWLLCVAKNCDWSRKITPLSNLTPSVASRRKKTYIESRIDLWNLQILKKTLEKSSQFLSSEQPCEPKSLDVTLNIAGVQRIRSQNLRLRSIWRPFDSGFELRSVSDGGNMCPLWLVILKSVWNSVRDTF